MSNYTKRTCHSCGVRMPQPEMFRVSISKVTSSYQRSLSGREVVGAVFGEKSSQKSVRNWMWAPNKRSRTSYRDVWLCGSCNSSPKPLMGNSNDANQTLIGAAIIFCVVFLALVANFSDSESSRSRTQDRADNLLQGNTSKVDEQAPADVSVTHNYTAQKDIDTIAPSFVIQVGSFTVQENLELAERIINRLGLMHEREIATVNEGYFWRLLVSGRDSDDLASTLELLRVNGFADAFVR
jgi:hypothetical protein